MMLWTSWQLYHDRTALKAFLAAWEPQPEESRAIMQSLAKDEEKRLGLG